MAMNVEDFDKMEETKMVLQRQWEVNVYGFSQKLYTDEGEARHVFAYMCEEYPRTKVTLATRDIWEDVATGHSGMWWSLVEVREIPEGECDCG